MNITSEQAEAFEALMREVSTRHVRFADHAEIDRIGGYTWIAPGVVPLDHWRPERAVSDEQAHRANSYAAVGLRSTEERT